MPEETIPTAPPADDTLPPQNDPHLPDAGLVDDPPPPDQPVEPPFENTKLEIGSLHRIKNLHNAFGQEAHYVAARLEEENGEVVTAVFTEAEIAAARCRHDRAPAEVDKAPPLVDAIEG